MSTVFRYHILKIYDLFLNILNTKKNILFLRGLCYYYKEYSPFDILNANLIINYFIVNVILKLSQCFGVPLYRHYRVYSLFRKAWRYTVRRVYLFQWQYCYWHLCIEYIRSISHTRGYRGNLHKYLSFLNLWLSSLDRRGKNAFIVKLKMARALEIVNCVLCPESFQLRSLVWICSDVYYSNYYRFYVISFHIKLMESRLSIFFCIF